jgi:hypothetical protein
MRSADTKREIAGIVARLLLHYFVPGELSDSARKAMAEDWVEDLGEYPPQTVADACREWRRKPINRRPLPGEIRALCIDQQTAAQERQQLTGPTDMDAYARSVGWANNAERMEAIAKSKRDSAADGERLRQIDRELKARQAERTVREALSRDAAEKAAAEHMRRSQIALGIKAAPEPEPEEDREWATEELA